MFESISDFSCAISSGNLSAIEILEFRKINGIRFRYHPLGFFACTLYSFGSSNVRLHCWPSSGGRKQSSACQIHDHVFDFQSFVLVGSLENIEYKINQSGVQYARYEAEYNGDNSILKKSTDRIRLASADSKIYLAGDSYHVNAGVLHETRRVGSGPALTVLITRDVSSRAPIVLGPIDGAFRYEYHRAIVPERELDLILSGI